MRGACSESSIISVQSVRHFNNSRYYGYRSMIESSQALSLRLPQRGSAPHFAIEAAKSGLVAIRSTYKDSEVESVYLLPECTNERRGRKGKNGAGSRRR